MNDFNDFASENEENGENLDIYAYANRNENASSLNQEIDFMAEFMIGTILN